MSDYRDSKGILIEWDKSEKRYTSRTCTYADQQYSGSLWIKFDSDEVHPYESGRPHGDSGLELLINRLMQGNYYFTNVRKIDLGSQNLTDEVGEQAAMILRSKSSLRYLSLSSNKFTDITVRHVAHYLRTNTNCRWLSLSGNKITDTGGQYLIEALKDNSTLMSLSVSGISASLEREIQLLLLRNIVNNVEEIVDRPYNYVLGDPLSFLHQLSDEDLSIFFDAAIQGKMYKFTRMRFKCAGSVSDKSVERMAQLLKTNKTIEELEFEGPNITDVGGQHLLEAMKYNATLKRIGLRECTSLSPGMKRAIEDLVSRNSKNPQQAKNEVAVFRESLGQGIQVNSEFIEYGGEKIDFNVSSGVSKLSDVDLEKVLDSLTQGKFTSLKEIRLGCNSLSEVAVDRIAQVLETSSTITHLDLSKINLSDISVERIARLLRQNKFLRMISLEGNANITDVGARHLLEAMKCNSSLTGISKGETSISQDLNDEIDAFTKRNKENPHQAETDVAAFIAAQMEAAKQAQVEAAKQAQVDILLCDDGKGNASNRRCCSIL